MIRSGILDNQTVGVDELRAMISTIVPKGGIIDTWENGTPYNLAILNQIIEDTTTNGIVPESEGQLRVSYGGGRAVVNTGKAIFPNGVITEVTEEEELVADISYGTKYIVLMFNGGEQVAKLLCVGEVPEDTEAVFYIPLARIDVNGNVKDLRTYAEVMGTTEKRTACYEIEFDCAEEGLTGDSNLHYSGKGTKKMPMSGAYYNYLMVQGSKCLSLVTDIDEEGAIYDSYTSQADMTKHNPQEAYIYITSGSEMTATFRRDINGLYMDYNANDMPRKFKFKIYASVAGNIVIGGEL